MSLHVLDADGHVPPSGRAAGPEARGGARASSSFSSPPALPAGTSVSRSYAKNVSATSRRERRGKRDLLREVLNDVSTLPRCHNCGWAESGDSGSSGPQIAAQGDVAYWRGVQTCGSIWSCPCCGAKIRNGRAVEISEFAADWIYRGNEVYMVTFTFPHDVGMALASLMLLISAAFRSVISGRAWAGTPARSVPERPSKRGGMLPARFYPAKPGVRERLGIAGTIRSLEVTHGPNGWHPHLHVLVFVCGVLDVDARCEFELYFRRQWRNFITGRGYQAPSGLRGVKTERCYSGDGAADYICKTQDGKNPGNEMARSDMKTARDGHRTPFQILEDFRRDGWADLREDGMLSPDLKLWWEYEKATFRHQAITWSHGLRQMQRDQLGVEEKTDDELAAEEVNGLVVADVSPVAVRVVSRIPGLRVRLLESWEDGGLFALLVLAEKYGIRSAPVLDGSGVKLFWADPRQGSGRGDSESMDDVSFYCEICGGTHPLRGHRACRRKQVRAA